ncbi:hypothetical protein O3P69_014899 [Scylla paramamosain]|uniref:Uncharacterized protein n=1 Tax=Scylla paramamosain TaxID=85552 RepID=A0AAW0U1Y0_SCYPA
MVLFWAAQWHWMGKQKEEDLWVAKTPRGANLVPCCRENSENQGKIHHSFWPVVQRNLSRQTPLTVLASHSCVDWPTCWLTEREGLAGCLVRLDTPDSRGGYDSLVPT